MSIALGEVQYECRSALPSCAAHPLEVVGCQRRYGHIELGIQVADVDTHLKGGCSNEAVYGVRIRPELEVPLYVLPLGAAQQSGMFM